MVQMKIEIWLFLDSPILKFGCTSNFGFIYDISMIKVERIGNVYRRSGKRMGGQFEVELGLS